MEWKEVRQIDLLVHPDYYVSCYNIDFPGREQLKKHWSDRVEQLAANETAFLFYFPCLSDTNPVVSSSPIQVYAAEYLAEEKARREMLTKMLRERFICFTVGELWVEEGASGFEHRMFEFLSKRQLAVNSQNVNIYSYGEYYDLCVTAWRVHISNVLKIPERHTRNLKELSLDSNITFTYE